MNKKEWKSTALLKKTLQFQYKKYFPQYEKAEKPEQYIIKQYLP